MKYVLDASIALKWVIPESDSSLANQLRDEFQNGVHELIAPSIFPGEIAHTLTKLERRQILSVGDSQPLLDDVLLTCPFLSPYLPLLNHAREISSQTRSGFFDCLYVALAEQESCDLITADSKLINNLHHQFGFIKSLTEIP